jgi:hypothetical protein
MSLPVNYGNSSDFINLSASLAAFSIFTDSLFPIGTHNTLRNATVRLTYTPYPGLQLMASVYHNDLQTNNRLGGFNANGANINLQYTYGKR